MKFIDIHTHADSNSNSVISILNCYPTSIDFSVPFSIGIHPWFINQKTVEQDIHFIKEQLQHKNCYAVGECGLDKLSEIDFSIQLTFFKEQIELSEDLKKPLIIHCVKSFQEILHIKKEIKPKQRWIIHGFNKSNQIASELLKNGCFLSFGKLLLTSPKLQEVFSNTPLDKVFLETDDSEINILAIYEKAATIRNIEVKELQKNIHQNFNKIFTK
jgi:TatD DNase family protein